MTDSKSATAPEAAPAGLAAEGPEPEQPFSGEPETLCEIDNCQGIPTVCRAHYDLAATVPAAHCTTCGRALHAEEVHCDDCADDMHEDEESQNGTAGPATTGEPPAAMVGAVYRHKKGDLYTVEGVALESTNGRPRERVVIYRGTKGLNVRSEAEFMDGRFTFHAECTGVSAQWCPIHGDCKCPEQANGERSLNDFDCPLHSRHSTHAEAAASPKAVPAGATGEPAALEWRPTDYGAQTEIDSTKLTVALCLGGDFLLHFVHRLPLGATLADAKTELERIYRAAFGPRLSQAEREAIELLLRGVHHHDVLSAARATLAPLLEPEPR